MAWKRSFFTRAVFNQSLIALIFNVGGLLSGRLAVIFTSTFASSSWILAIYPLVLTVRGCMGGILSGRLGTMLHTGEVKPQLRGNTTSFYSLLGSIFVLTFFDTLCMGLIAFVFNLIFHQTTFQNLGYFITLPVITCVLGVLFAIPLTLFVAIKAFQSGLDPDIVVYPIMATTNDILISLIYVTAVFFLLRSEQSLLIMELLTIPVALFAFFLCVRYFREPVFKRTFREGVPIILFSSFLGALNGTALESFRGNLERHPSILILYPPLMNILGNIGSIIGSMETTKLALGYIRSFTDVLKETAVDLISVETAAFLIHIILSFLTFVVGNLSNIPVDAFFLIKVALTSNFIGFLIISVFSLTIATQTFKWGLDPDNFVIPLTTSVSDTVSTLSLILVLSMVSIR